MLFCFSSVASEYNSVAFCKPLNITIGVNHLELMYNFDGKGVVIVELEESNGVEREAVDVFVQDNGSSLRVTHYGDAEVYFDIPRNDPDATLKVDGDDYYCERADW